MGGGDRAEDEDMTYHEVKSLHVIYQTFSYHDFRCYGGFVCQGWFLHDGGFVTGFWRPGGRIRCRGCIAVPLRELVQRNSGYLVMLFPQLAQPQALIVQLTFQLQDLHLRRDKQRTMTKTVPSMKVKQISTELFIGLL